ncbi:MAG: MFS transporter [Coxiellaceae bacterium]|nr:MFS transporter [Coxiellaceae bacterium]
MLTHQIKTLLLCLLLTPLMCLGLDLYTPSLPAIASYFKVTNVSANLTIVFYIAGFGLSQPIAGIIGDSLERKSFILNALIIYCLSSFLSSFSHTITWLYFFRIVNSLCAACTAASIKIMIAENFHGKMLEKATNYYGLFWSITPIFAPVIGGYLQHYFGWQSNFYCMGIYGFICLFLCLFLMKKHIPKKSLNESLLKKTFFVWKTLLTDTVYIICVFILSVENSILFLYYTTAPFIIQTKLGFNAETYGKIVLFVGISYVIGNIINGKLLNYVSSKKIICGGLLISTIISLSFLIYLYFFPKENIYIITLPIFLLFICDGLVFTNILSQVIRRYTEHAGAAGGLLGGLLNLLSAVIVYITSYFWNMHNVLTLSIAYFSLLFASLLCFVFFMYKNNYFISGNINI